MTDLAIILTEQDLGEYIEIAEAFRGARDRGNHVVQVVEKRPGRQRIERFIEVRPAKGGRHGVQR